MSKLKKTAPETPAAHEPNEFDLMSDQQIIDESRKGIALMKLLVKEGHPIDPAEIKQMQAALDKFERSVAAEKVAVENARLANEAVKRTADAILALIGENDRPRAIYVPHHEILGKIKRKKGN